MVDESWEEFITYPRIECAYDAAQITEQEYLDQIKREVDQWIIEESDFLKESDSGSI